MFRRLLIVTVMAGLAASSGRFGRPSLAYGAPGEATTFKVRVENVSTGKTLKLSTGATAPAPNAPGIYLVTTQAAPLFTSGQPDRREGLEPLCEDGNPSILAAHLRAAAGVQASGVFNTPVGDETPGPATPGKAFEFTVTAPPGARLYLASMFGQSNDLFYAPDENGIALFGVGGKPVDGELTSRMFLWDAGTEVNEEPGAGPNQAPRQSAPNTGVDEHGVVRRIDRVKDGFTYPPTAQVIRVTIHSVVTSTTSGGAGR